ncbi:hypothetical protein C0J56_26080 [Pseudomonas fluorescens]|nr:hypothetical protein C0J56_26080 [Pseudomonas fluorescens]
MVITKKFKCGSGLARESDASVNKEVECDDAFASKPAPTLAPRWTHYLLHIRSPVGASLLAMASAQAMNSCDTPPQVNPSPAPHAVYSPRLFNPAHAGVP